MVSVGAKGLVGADPTVVGVTDNSELWFLGGSTSEEDNDSLRLPGLADCFFSVASA